MYVKLFPISLPPALTAPSSTAGAVRLPSLEQAYDASIV